MKVFERGPFGCLIHRGTIDSLEEVPPGYQVQLVEEEEGTTVYISPTRED